MQFELRALLVLLRRVLGLLQGDFAQGLERGMVRRPLDGLDRQFLRLFQHGFELLRQPGKLGILFGDGFFQGGETNLIDLFLAGKLAARQFGLETGLLAGGADPFFPGPLDRRFQFLVEALDSGLEFGPPVNFPVIRFRLTSQGQTRLNAIDV